MAQAVTATTNKTNYVPNDKLIVTGTGPANDDVTVLVTSPRGNPVGQAQGKVGSDNRYNIEVFTWPPTNSTTFPFGAYSIKVTAAAAGSSTTVSVNFLASTVTTPPPTPTPAAGRGFWISVHSEGTYFAGDTVLVDVMFTNNGALADPTAITIAHVHRSDNVVDQLLGAQQRVHAGWYYFPYTIPNNAPPGTYGVHIAATLGTAIMNEAATFRVESNARNVATVGGAVANLNTAVASLNTAVTALSQTVAGLTLTALDTRLTALDTKVTALDSKINALQGAIGQQITGAQQAINTNTNNVQTALTTAVQGAQSSITSAVNQQLGGVSSKIDAMQADTRSAAAGTAQSSTFVLVIAGLAALIVVLQIAILVRKRA
ncbi:MAG: hypothetical protein HYU02_04885 [Thaumarchaeota archaeon]|nr:hypothetical protein [Nitrososphaerota archaeon]